MAEILKQLDLHFFGGGSDKVYHIALVAEDNGTYSTAFAYGRRNSTLSQGHKVVNTSSAQAEQAFRKLANEKIGKGYVESEGVSGSNVFSFLGKVSTAPSSSSGFIPTPTKSTVELERTGIAVQLLNAIDETELQHYLSSPSYGAQEKKNGERRAACLRDGDYFTSNRKGFKVSCPAPVAEALSKTGFPSMVVDGELIGDIFFAFDLLFADGKDYTGLPFFTRFKNLTALFTPAVGKHFVIVPLVLSCFDKTALLERLRKEGREGMVFKELSAPVVPGKPASGGSQLKYKFVEDCQVIVSSINTKRSVAICVLDDKGRSIGVGNVTIPPNHNIPSVGDVVAVEYLYYYEGGSLYQPVYGGVRTDLDIEDCTLAQLKRAPLDMAA